LVILQLNTDQEQHERFCAALLPVILWNSCSKLVSSSCNCISSDSVFFICTFLSNERIEKSGEGKDPEVFKQKKEDLVILQLNTDQEQHERIQAIRELKESYFA
jgi:hypothetical protein